MRPCQRLLLILTLANNTGSTNSSVAATVPPEITVTGPSMVVAGEPITWSVTVYNPSPYTATGVVVSDPLPRWGCLPFVEQHLHASPTGLSPVNWRHCPRIHA